MSIIKTGLSKVYDHLTSVNRFVFITYASVLSIEMNKLIASLPIAENMHDVAEINDVREKGPYILFLLVIVLAPTLETLFLQLFPIRLVQHLFRKKSAIMSGSIAMFFSALLFSLQHCYNLTYMIATFMGGLVFAGAFLLSDQRKENAFINIMLIHMIYNGFIYVKDLHNYYHLW